MQSNIYITNFWYAVNYGANLTAYALYKLFSEFDCNTYLNKYISFKDFVFYSNIYAKKFIEKYCKTEKYKKNDNNILVTGSDQVFNPNCEPNYNNSKFLNFANCTDKKIAFSASFGVDKEQFLKENPSEFIEKIKKSLKSFDLISVREKSGVKICKDVFGVEAEWIIDPVFILKKEKWDELIKNSNCDNKDKIATYIFDSTAKHKQVYKYLSEKYNAEIVELEKFNLSPENWLSSIKNCSFLITNSFHGMCFAIIFNKPFICLSKETGKSTRFDSVFEMLGIKNQCINSIDEICEKDCIFKIDYEKVNKRIEEERQRGLDFLKKTLESPCGKQKEKREVRENYLEEKICELEKQASLKYQIKQKLWYLWLIIWYKFLPKSVKNLINIFRRKKNA